MGIPPKLLQAIMAVPPKPTILRINTLLDLGTGLKQFRLPLVATGIYRFVADWGDGNKSIITVWNQAETTHLYAADGIYTITITGVCCGWAFNPGGDRLKLIEISQWGDSWRLVGTNPVSAFAFRDCANLQITAADGPDFTGATEVYYFLRGCTSLTTIGGVSTWDFQNIFTIYEMFRGCSSFNDDVGAWDMSGINDTERVFYGCTAFNNGGSAAIGTWDMSGVTNTAEMFLSATAFNQPIAGWDMSAATILSNMFRDAVNFNQPIGAWDVSAAQNMNAMLYGCTLFTADLNAWDVGNVTQAGYMLHATGGGAGGAHPPLTLTGWNTSKFTRLDGFIEFATWGAVDLSGWDISKVTTLEKFAYFNSYIPTLDSTGWDTSAVTNMSNAFRSALLFNSSTAHWNVEANLTFVDMFSRAALHKQNLGEWWPRSASSGFSGMFFNDDINNPNSPTNVLTATQDYTSVVWVKGVVGDTVTANALAAPDGTTTADKLKPSVTSSANHSWTQTKTVTNGVSKTVRVALKAGELTYGQLKLTGAITADVYVDLTTGAIVSSSGSVSVTDIGGGWWVLEIVAVTSTTSLAVAVLVWDNATGTAFAGNASDGIYVWQASVFLSSDSTANYDALLTGWTGWAGTGAGSATLQGVTATPTVAAPGSGYAVGDRLLVSGGTVALGGKTVEVEVATIDGGGGVLTVTRKRGNGNYSATPANPVATTGGAGVGCTLTLAWVTKFSALPTSKIFTGDNAKYSLKDGLAVAARKNLVLAVGSGGKGWTITDGGVI